MRKFFLSIGVFTAALFVAAPAAQAQLSAQANVLTNTDPNYRYHDNQWWYAMPNQQWMLWTGNSWVGSGANGRFAGPNGRYYYPPRYAVGPQPYTSGYRSGNYGNGYYGNRYYNNNRGANIGANVGGALGGNRGAGIGAAIGGAIR